MRSSGIRFNPKGTSTAAALLAAILLFLVIGFGFASKRVQDQEPYLSFSADTDGLKGVRELLEAKGLDVKEWRQPWVQLPEDKGGLLVVAEPYEPDPKELAAVRTWLEQGNRMVLISRNPQDWSWAEIETSSSQGSAPTPGTKAVVERAEGASYPAAKLEATPPEADLRLKLTKVGAETLLQDEAGGLAARYTIGSGTLTVMLVSEWFRNDRILENGHFELLWPILLEELQASEGKVRFDEYHHGYHAKAGPLAVYPNWMLVIYLQLAIVVLLLLWMKGRRFGPIRTPREWVVRRGDETLLAVSGWYRRKKLKREALFFQEQFMRQLAQERWGVRTTAVSEELVRAARLNGGEALGERMAVLLERLELVRQGASYSDKAFLEDSRAMAEIIQVWEKE